MEIDIMRIAELAKLSIPDDKVDKFKSDITDMIKLVENLPDLPTDGSLIDPNDVMELREDIVKPSWPRDEILKNAPSTRAGCLLIPKVVD
jgi:aspartyl-tRNA(Asn)/glutamyl-tRNA(Gln) amidotransferase subunit C